jgi:3-ketosteroid 9alpha-monooxygenase subunit B
MADAHSAAHRARVVEVIQETEDAHSIVLEVDLDAKDAFAYKPGQFLTVAVPSDQTGTVARCYSLSSAPHETDLLKITVKRTVEGYGSNWICDNVASGDTLTVLPPSGIFTPASLDSDFLLFAAGSGVTPVISIAKAALAKGSGAVVMLYANRDEKSVIFARELTDLAEKHPDRFVVVHWLESVQGLPSMDHMRAFAEHFTSYDAFVCGPGPFMQGVVTALKEIGFPRERRHQEKFVSLGGNPFGDEVEVIDAEEDESGDRIVTRDAPATVSGDLDGNEFTFDDWAGDKKLLDFLLEKGLDAPSSCRDGNCSACAYRLVEGEVTLLHNEVLDDEDLADGLRLACQSLPVSDIVRISYQ